MLIFTMIKIFKHSCINLMKRMSSEIGEDSNPESHGRDMRKTERDKQATERGNGCGESHMNPRNPKFSDYFTVVRM